MNKVMLAPYKMASASGKALADALGIKRKRKNNSRYKHSASKTLINWGDSSLANHSSLPTSTIINPSPNVAIAANKIWALEHMQNAGVSVPEWTTDIDVACDWEGAIVERHVICGSQGQVIVDPEETPNPAPLYTKYIKKRDEYRIHVGWGEAIDAQRKARNRSVASEDVNWQVRNHANGFIFMRENVQVTEDMKAQSIAAVKALGLHFGAVDLILGTDCNVYVLEVNTAPALTGTTLDKYVKMFTSVLEDANNVD